MSEFIHELQFAEHVKSKYSGDVWLVGGALRDEVLGETSKDKDYVITGVNANDLKFDKVAGKDFPVFLVKIANQTCEVAVARKERKMGLGYKGFKFYTDKLLTINDDLYRRDLTMNAMAKNIISNEIIDPYNGYESIKSKTLKHVSEAFAEDPLRVLRVARFASRFNFSVDEETKELMKKIVPELIHISTERIWKELETVLAYNNPSIFFKVLDEVNALPIIFPEIEALKVPDKHDGTAYNHTLKVLDSGDTPIERFALLVHDFGKGVTPKEKHPSHFQHEKLGVSVVENFCDRLRVPNKYKKFGLICTYEHMRMKFANEMKAGKFVKFVLKLGKDFNSVLEVSKKDSLNKEGETYQKTIDEQTFKQILQKADIVFETERRVTGKTLLEEGYEQSSKFGEILFNYRVSDYIRSLKTMNVARNENNYKV